MHPQNQQDDVRNLELMIGSENMKGDCVRSVSARRPVLVRCMEWLGEWAAVPMNVARCPECRSQLQAWVDGWSEGSGYTIMLECTLDNEDGQHRFYQSDWQPVMDVVKAWANSPSDKLSDLHQQPEATKQGN